MSRYFLSYARADAAFALRLAGDLRAAGIDLWIDQRDILPSQRWDRAVETALRDCASVVVLLTPRSAASENVLDEIGFALDHRKEVIPLLLEMCEVPMRINRLQRVDVAGDYGAALERCKAALRGERPQATPRRGFDPAIVERAEQDLTVYLGPIADKLTAAAAVQAANAADLYRRLAEHIPDRGDRAAFLRNAPAHSGLQPAVVFSRPMLESVILELTKVLGPIARPVVQRAARDAASADELFDRVTASVSDPEEREALLQRLRAL